MVRVLCFGARLCSLSDWRVFAMFAAETAVAGQVSYAGKARLQEIMDKLFAALVKYDNALQRQCDDSWKHFGRALLMLDAQVCCLPFLVSLSVLLSHLLLCCDRAVQEGVI